MRKNRSDTFSFDFEGSANQSEERGIEGHHPVSVKRHVHRYETLREREEEKDRLFISDRWMYKYYCESFVA